MKQIIFSLLFVWSSFLCCTAFQRFFDGHTVNSGSFGEARSKTTCSSTIQEDVEIAPASSQPPIQSISLKPSKQDTYKVIGSTRTNLKVMIREAQEEDFIHVAELRLSVFSLINPLLRKRFVSRSIQFMRERRKLGATCLIATTMDGNPPTEDYAQVGTPDDEEYNLGGVLATLECSFHEFDKSKMSCSPAEVETRTYITEVAVWNKCRRMGIGKVLMDAAEVWAVSKGYNQIYLHVNDLNESALGLYSKAGYRCCPKSDYHLDFTNSLGLGSLKQGQRHTLLMKDVGTS